MEVTSKLNFIDQDLFKAKLGFSDVDLYIDKPREGYSLKGVNPLEMFLTSVGGCVGVYAKRYLTRHNIRFNKLDILVSANLSKELPMRLADIKVEVDTDADIGDKKEVFERFIHNCPVHNTLLHTKEVNIKLL